jgi:hypothetical protein
MVSNLTTFSITNFRPSACPTKPSIWYVQFNTTYIALANSDTAFVHIDPYLNSFTNSDIASATGSNWEKYKKGFADDEIEEKKITPLTDE